MYGLNINVDVRRFLEISHHMHAVPYLQLNIQTSLTSTKLTVLARPFPTSPISSATSITRT